MANIENTGKITDVISDEAFEQIERFRIKLEECKAIQIEIIENQKIIDTFG